ncbi:MAG: VWA domain-containing protein [Actinobacteria bacterium]|nr:VWA domain-containing protein [Actinomycetota bacterium]
MFAGGGTSQFGVSLGYAVDIVFVIDITGSMTPVIEQVKAGALSFHDRLLETMAAKDKYVSSLRLRVVVYRDYYDNPSDALFHTPFFRLPEEQEHFNTYVGALSADGGGDEPESGLEGLAVAFGSDWERGMDRRRHVVVLFTDASAHPLEASQGRYVPGYPSDMPATFDELTDLWDDPQGSMMEYASKRLLMYAPDVYPWNVISAYWDNVLHYPSAAGQGLNEIEFGQIIDAIAGSV